MKGSPLLKTIIKERRLPYRYLKIAGLIIIKPKFYLTYFIIKIIYLLKNNNEPGISIIIPCYNQAKYLEEAVSSVIKQAYSSFEIIIVNDSSSDNTLEISNSIINKYRNFDINIITNTTNQGLANSRNIGINKSKYEYVFLLDADDKIHAKTLRILYLFLDFMKADAACPGVYKFGTVNKKCWKKRLIKEKQPFMNNFLPVSLYRKKALERVGGFDNTMIYGWEDWDFSLKLIENDCKVIDVPKPLYYYRRNTVSMVSTLWKDEKKKREMLLQLIKNHPEIYSNFSLDDLAERFRYRNIDMIKFRQNLNVYLNN